MSPECQDGGTSGKRPHWGRCSSCLWTIVPLAVERGTAANRFFQRQPPLQQGSLLVTSNRRPSQWAELFGDDVLAAAILDRLQDDAEVLTINGPFGGRGLAQGPRC